MIDTEVLRGLFLFEKLDEEKLQWLGEVRGRGGVRRGEAIIKQGDPADCFAVLVEGEVVMVTEASAGTSR